MNYVRELVRSSEYRQIPDLNPVRHVLYKGAWLRVEGWRKYPERNLTRKQCLKAALVCGAIAAAAAVGIFASGCDSMPWHQENFDKPVIMKCYDRNGKLVGTYQTYDHDRERTIQALPLDYATYPLLGRKIDAIDYFEALTLACNQIAGKHLDINAGEACRHQFLKEEGAKRDPLSFE